MLRCSREYAEVLWGNFLAGWKPIFVASGQNSTGAPIHQQVKHKPVIYFFLHNVLWIFWISFVDNVDTRWKLPPICWFKNNCLVTHKVCCSTNWPIMTVTVKVLHAQASWALELFQFRVHRYVKGGLLFLKIWPPIFVWGGGGAKIIDTIIQTKTLTFTPKKMHQKSLTWMVFLTKILERS